LYFWNFPSSAFAHVFRGPKGLQVGVMEAMALLRGIEEAE